MAVLTKFGVPAGTSSETLMPKMVYRFRVLFNDLGGPNNGDELLVLTRQVISVTRPTLTHDEMQLDVYNSRIYLAGKHTWDPITLQFRDDVSSVIIKRLDEQLQRQINHAQQSAATSGSQYKFQMGILAKVPQKKLATLLKIPFVSGFIKQKLKKNLGLSRARSTISGSAPLQLSIIEWFKKVDIFITNGYGMTENCAICTQVDGRDFEKLDSVGKPQCGVEIKVDQNTEEILMRGPFVMNGYYKNEKMTKATLVNGWLRTGDKGYLDKDNYLYVTGRVADSFKTSKGKFIEPLTLENHFGNFKELEEVCVTGLGLPQPIALAQLSEIGKALPKEELIGLMEVKLAEINAALEKHKKISTLILVKEEWSERNKIMGPTLKIKRGNVENMYSKNYKSWHEAPNTVLFEK